MFLSGHTLLLNCLHYASYGRSFHQLQNTTLISIGVDGLFNTAQLKLIGTVRSEDWKHTHRSFIVTSKHAFDWGDMLQTISDRHSYNLNRFSESMAMHIHQIGPHNFPRKGLIIGWWRWWLVWFNTLFQFINGLQAQKSPLTAYLLFVRSQIPMHFLRLEIGGTNMNSKANIQHALLHIHKAKDVDIIRGNGKHLGQEVHQQVVAAPLLTS